MSVAAVRRSFRVIHYLKAEGETRFTDLVRLLSPISRTALSDLLNSLEEIGELEHDGRVYRLASTAAVLSANLKTIYALPPTLVAQTNPMLQRTAQACGHSCAIFGRVGTSTMKLMDACNVGDAAERTFAPVGRELPLMPMNAFARLFLAHASEDEARDAYRHWAHYLPVNGTVRTLASEDAFIGELAKIRRNGYAIEYKEESQALMRVAVPILLPGCRQLQFAVGLASHFVYLLGVRYYVETLRTVAGELATVLRDKVPLSSFEPPASPSAPAVVQSDNISAFPAHAWRSSRRRLGGDQVLAVG